LEYFLSSTVPFFQNSQRMGKCKVKYHIPHTRIEHEADWIRDLFFDPEPLITLCL